MAKSDECVVGSMRRKASVFFLITKHTEMKGRGWGLIVEGKGNREEGYRQRELNEGKK